jgi:hypothetical protein
MNQADYGNWVSRKTIYVPGFFSLILLGLAYFSLFFLIGGAFFLAITGYFLYSYLQFSPLWRVQPNIDCLMHNKSDSMD